MDIQGKAIELIILKWGDIKYVILNNQWYSFIRGSSNILYNDVVSCFILTTNECIRRNRHCSRLEFIGCFILQLLDSESTDLRLKCWTRCQLTAENVRRVSARLMLQNNAVDVWLAPGDQKS